MFEERKNRFKNRNRLSYVEQGSVFQLAAVVLAMLVVVNLPVASCNGERNFKNVKKQLAAITTKTPITLQSAEDDPVTTERLALFMDVLYHIVYRKCVVSGTKMVNNGELNSFRSFVMRLIHMGKVEVYQTQGSQRFAPLYRNLTECYIFLTHHPTWNQRQVFKNKFLLAAQKSENKKNKLPPATSSPPPRSVKDASIWEKSLSQVNKAVRPIAQASKKAIKTTNAWAASFYNTAKGWFTQKRHRRDVDNSNNAHKKIPHDKDGEAQVRINKAYEHFVHMIRNMSFLATVECPKNQGFILDPRTMKGFTDLLSSLILKQLAQLEKQGLHVKVNQNVDKNVQQCVKQLIQG